MVADDGQVVQDGDGRVPSNAPRAVHRVYRVTGAARGIAATRHPQVIVDSVMVADDGQAVQDGDGRVPPNARGTIYCGNRVATAARGVATSHHLQVNAPF